MKKRKLFTLGIACAAIMFTTSCSEDEEADAVGPRLDVTENISGSTSGDVTVAQGATLQYIWDARKGDSDLQTFSVTLNGTNIVNPIPASEQGLTFPYSVSSSNDELYIDTLEFNAGPNIGVTSYTFTVTDELGNSASRTFDVSVVAGTQVLSDPMNFTWQRVAGAPGTGLSQFGLEWVTNTSTNAIIAVDGAMMYSLPASDWDNIATHQELQTAIDGATAITQYTEVSSQASGTYDDVLAVTYLENNYLINVQNGTVTTPTGGTTITVTGQYKD
jgi:hypothetical protein